MNSERKISVAVIGAGVVGICCACYLQRSGFRVTLIDRDEPALQTSFGNAGGLSPGSVAPIGMPGMWKQIPGWLLDDTGPLYIKGSYLVKALPWLTRFLLQSRSARVADISKALASLNGPCFEALQPLVEDAGISHMIKRSGQLFVYRSRKHMQKDALTHQLRGDAGARLEYLDAAEIRDLEPALAPIFESGYLMPDNGHCDDPYGMAQALVRSFLERGGRFQKTEVADFGFDEDGVTCVKTSTGDLQTDRAIICAGIWSKSICAKLGWNIPLESHRGYHVTLEDPGASLKHMCFPVEDKFAITPMSMGIRIAGTVELAGVDAPPNYARAQALLVAARKILPGIGTEKATQWMGHRPCFPDSLPVIDRCSNHKGIFFAFGHGHQGLVGASQTGKVVDEMIRGVSPSMDLRPFSIDRF